MGRSRSGLTSKIHALVDAEGRPVNPRLTGGQVADRTQADALTDDIGGGPSFISCHIRRQLFRAGPLVTIARREAQSETLSLHFP